MAIEKQIVAKLTLDGKQFTKGLQSAGKAAIALGAATAAIGAGLLTAAKATADFQDETIKAARTIGATAEEFGRLKFAAELSAVPIALLTKSLASLNAPTKLQRDEFKRLGVSLKDNTGRFKEQGELVNDLADAFKGMQSPVQRSAAAFKLFGSRGVELVNLLQVGSEGLKEMGDEAERLGLVFSEQAGVNAELFNDNIARLTSSFTGLRNVFSETIIEFVNANGVVTGLTAQVEKLIKGWRDLDDDTKELIVQLLAGVVAFGGILTVIAGIALALPILIAALVSVTGIIGIVVVGVAALVIAIDGWIVTTEELIEMTDEEVRALKDAEAVIISLAGKTKLSTIETKKLAEADAALKKAAEELNIALFNENGELKTNIQLLEEAKKSKTKKIAADILDIRIKRSDEEIRRDSISSTARALSASQGLTDEFDKNVRAAKAGTFQVGDFGSAAVFAFIDAEKSAKRMGDTIDTLEASIVDLNKKSKPVSFNFLNIAAAAGGGAEKFKAFRVALDPFNAALLRTSNSFEDTSGALKANIKNLEKQISMTAIEVEKNAIRVEIRVLKQREAIEDLAAFANTADQVAGKVGVLTNAVGMLADNAAKAALRAGAVLSRDLDIQLARFTANLEAQIEAAEKAEDERIAALEAQFDKEIEALRKQEEAKLDVIRAGGALRLVALDEEFQKAKALRDAEFAAFVESEGIKFEFEKELILQKALDKEERRLAEVVLDEDFKQFILNAEAAHEQSLTDLAKEFANMRKGIDIKNKAELKTGEQKQANDIQALIDKRDAALIKAQEERDARLTALDEEKAAGEKALGKQKAQAQFDAELAAFKSTKVTKIAETIASGISGAAQAFANLALIPFIGPGLGAAAAAVILAATAQSVGRIESTAPIKPAELSLQGGGVLSGARHGTGGININAEDGEGVIDRGRTAMLIEAVDRIGAGGGSSFTFQFAEGAVQTVAINSEEAVEEFSMMVAQRLEREGVFSPV